MNMDIRYDCRWSDKTDEKFIRDFCFVEDEVFKNKYSIEDFNKKFKENIYGESVVVVVYIDEKPVGARALWRNDIGKKESYQPCDTCVTEVCRGKGVFSEMTNLSLKHIPKDSLVYNFPNMNSRNGYLKLGWNVHRTYFDCLFYSIKEYLALHPQKMDDAYFNWWIQPDRYYVWKKASRFFLVRKNPKKPYMYFIKSEITEKAASNLKKVKLGVFFYRGVKKTFYNKLLPEFWIVSREMTDIDIPVWKMDVT